MAPFLMIVSPFLYFLNSNAARTSKTSLSSKDANVGKLCRTCTLRLSTQAFSMSFLSFWKKLASIRSMLAPSSAAMYVEEKVCS